MEFDFIDHQLRIATSSGSGKAVPLRAEAVADFYGRFRKALEEVDIETKISTMPNEIPDAVPFDEDHAHQSYVPEQAHRFWKVLLLSSLVMTQFRSLFIGKCSPVHFFWGSFDLAAGSQ